MIVFLDNCSVHVKAVSEVNRRLSNVTVKFLPGNCTSQLQPMDSGIICSYNSGYRCCLMQRVIANIDANKRLQLINVNDALHFAHAAWAAVTPGTTLELFLQK